MVSSIMNYLKNME